MTILDQITREAKALPAEKRQEALKLLRLIRSQSRTEKKAARKTVGKARAAIRAAAGIWKDRTDLPADSVEASIELRRRAMRRAPND